MSLHVVMLVNNNGHDDARVMKQAECLVSLGYRVTVVGVRKGNSPAVEVINGVTYKRVTLDNGVLVLLASLIPFLSKTLLKMAPVRVIDAQDLGGPVDNGALVERNFFQKLSAFTKAKSKKVLVLSGKYAKYMTVYLRKHLLTRTGLGVRILMNSYTFSLYKAALKEGGDIYHAHELWVLEAAALSAKKASAKLLYDSHELEAHRNNLWASKANQERIGYEEKYIGCADKVVAVSPGCANEISELYGIGDIHIVRNTPRSNFRSPKSTVRTDLGLNDSQPLMVYVGSVTINRGVELVLEAMQSLPGLHFALVGPANETVKSSLQCLSQSLGVSERVFFLGKKDSDELVTYISSSDFSVIPIRDVCLSYRYCLPNKLFESICAGLPVVATDLPDMARVIFSGKLGAVFDDGDVGSLINAITECLNNKEKYNVRSKLPEVIASYSFDAEQQVLKGIYNAFEQELHFAEEA